MKSPSPFEDMPVIGKLLPDDAAAKLREVGEEAAAAALENAAATTPTSFGLLSRLLPERLWVDTTHQFGYLPPGAQGRTPQDLSDVGAIAADLSLKNSRLKITLNHLRVADYPGGSTHRVLVDFYARNQVPGHAEDLHFNATYRVREGERAAVRGYPIFVGLNVGSEGVAFRCHTVNVKNEGDEAFLEFLEGDVFKGGLKLATTAQPAIVPLSSMALALFKTIGKRNRNVSVQDFELGLDFADTSMGARLAVGDYIAVQIPEKFVRLWRWEDWVYDPNSGLIVSRGDLDRLVPYNYIVFGVSRYEDT